METEIQQNTRNFSKKSTHLAGTVNKTTTTGICLSSFNVHIGALKYIANQFYTNIHSTPDTPSIQSVYYAYNPFRLFVIFSYFVYLIPFRNEIYIS